MKLKLFISVFLITVSAFTAKAQFYAGGSFSILSSPAFRVDGISISLNTGGFLNISPEVGYNLNEKWAVGGKASVFLVDDGSSLLSFSPYGRFTFYRNNAVSLFADGGIDLVWAGDIYCGIGIIPGILFKATPHFSFFGKYGYIGYSETPLNTSKGISLSSNDLNIGFYYNF